MRLTVSQRSTTQKNKTKSQHQERGVEKAKNTYPLPPSHLGLQLRQSKQQNKVIVQTEILPPLSLSFVSGRQCDVREVDFDGADLGVIICVHHHVSGKKQRRGEENEPVSTSFHLGSATAPR
jgi:hypothetical protein